MDLSTTDIDYTKYPVPRLRHHANPTLYLPEHEHHVHLRHYPPRIHTINWQQHFANGEPPTHLDVGAGLGKFLMETALRTPAANFLGIELRKTAVEWVQSVISGEKIPNAALLWYSVVNGMPFIADGSIEKIFYFFPDPWLKKKHYKRRAFSPALLNEFVRVLRPNGTLYLMTDVPEVDEYQQSVLREHGVFHCHSVESERDWPLLVRTDQERFCQKKNIPYVRRTCVVQ